MSVDSTSRPLPKCDWQDTRWANVSAGPWSAIRTSVIASAFVRSALVASLLAPPAFGTENDIYKWADEWGTIHYSDQPPVQASQSVQRLLIESEPPESYTSDGAQDYSIFAQVLRLEASRRALTQSREREEAARLAALAEAAQAVQSPPGQDYETVFFGQAGYWWSYPPSHRPRPCGRRHRCASPPGGWVHYPSHAQSYDGDPARSVASSIYPSQRPLQTRSIFGYRR